MNPLLVKQHTPFDTPAFDKIKLEHYKPAFQEAIKKGKEDIQKIIENTENPTFENTIETLELSGADIDTVAGIFFNLNEAETSDEMQALAPELSGLITDYANEVNLNPDLFAKVKKVYKSNPTLNEDQKELLKDTYKGFIKGGADLNQIDKKRYREITKRLSELSLKFNENVMAETNAFELHVVNEKDLEGLPDYVRDAATEEAQSRKKEGWIFTLHYPSYIPFLQHAKNRSLREKMYRAFTTRGNHNNACDNKNIITEIVNLRLEKANLLGYDTYADMVLEDRMAQNADNVKTLLDDIFDAGHPHAIKDKEAVEATAKKNGHTDELKRWDWAFYSELLRKEKYNLTDEMTKPYFELNSVINAVFGLAKNLYKLSFKPNSDIPTYHKDVTVYEVYGPQRKEVKAILFLDFHPRKGKSQGAWMTTFREQSVEDGKYKAPFVSLVMNFTKPTSKEPALLTFDEVTTFLHEFGHALHAMLSNVKYSSQSCTNVYRDFVELPSQMHENWALEKEWLDMWAKHYKTGEKMPDDLIQRIKDARNFNSGYASDRQISFGLVDMAWHSIKHPFAGDVIEFEQKIMSKAEQLPPVEGSAFNTAFGHIFAGGYAAGYYGYKWAEVLDADAFELFKQTGIFNKETARKFASSILEKGGTSHPMKLYKAFRGQEPSIEPLLRRDGLLS